MRCGKSTLDWLVLEHEDDEFPPSPLTPSRPCRPARSRRRTATVAGIAFAGLLMVGAALVHASERTYAEVEAELSDVMAAENWAEQHGRADVLRSLSDPQGPGDRHTDSQGGSSARAFDDELQAACIEGVDLSGDMAMLTVVTEDAKESQLSGFEASQRYRTAKFYRQTSEGWLRTGPDVRFWGPPRELETEHFRFLYRRRDSRAVMAAAARIEPIYAALRQDVGLESAGAGEKVTVEIGLFAVSTEGLSQLLVVDGWLPAPSPLLLMLPEGISEEDALVHAIVGPLAQHVAAEALRRTPAQCQWQTVARAIGLWLRAEQVMLPDREQLKRDRILQTWARATSAPLTIIIVPEADCTAVDAAGAYAKAQFALSLAMASNVATTFVDFAVSRYGREVVPRLIAGLHECDSWESLIATVFETTAPKFEAGWREHIEARYAIGNEATSTP